MADRENQPLNKPQMTTLAGRPVKVLYAPDGDILVACRTEAGEDCYVPLSALFAMFEHDLVAKLRMGGRA